MQGGKRQLVFIGRRTAVDRADLQIFRGQGGGACKFGQFNRSFLARRSFRSRAGAGVAGRTGRGARHGGRAFQRNSAKRQACRYGGAAGKLPAGGCRAYHGQTRVRQRSAQFPRRRYLCGLSLFRNVCERRRAFPVRLRLNLHAIRNRLRNRRGVRRRREFCFPRKKHGQRARQRGGTTVLFRSAGQAGQAGARVVRV